MEHIGYVFDLDGTEIHGQQTPWAKFSVDSYDYGTSLVRIFHVYEFDYIYP
jgi:hypothetical protein